MAIKGTIAPGAGISRGGIVDRVKTLQGKPIIRDLPSVSTYSSGRGRGSSSGGRSSGGGSSQPQPQPQAQVKPIDPIEQLREVITTGTNQINTIKSLNNENLRPIDSFQANTPLGKKLGFETTRSLFEKGAFGSVLKLEEQATQPFTDRGFDVAQGLK